MQANFTLTDEDWEKIEEAVLQEAIGNPDCVGNTWFKTEEEFEEWAGDRLWSMIHAALEAIGAELE